MNLLIKIWQLIDTYFLSFLLRKNSTATFWYIPVEARVCDKRSLQEYLNYSISPFYLIDFRKKIKYKLESEDDIILLNYPFPTGKQINVEAAFMYALGLHDLYLSEKKTSYLQKFMRYANYFLERQTKDGDWHYSFDWHTSKAPWGSALAQSRGASVMLRAWLITKDDRYLAAANQALSKFSIDIRDNGYRHIFDREHCFYFEEYPKSPFTVINGFMVTLFGLWEMSVLTEHEPSKELLTMAVKSLEKMLPHFTISWWTLYDNKKIKGLPNINSPYYHDLQLKYLKCLAALTNSEIFRQYLVIWQRQYKLPNKLLSVMAKVTFKLISY